MSAASADRFFVAVVFVWTGAGLYEGGIYRVHVTLPATYPYKSPSIGFQTKVRHSIHGYPQCARVGRPESLFFGGADFVPSLPPLFLPLCQIFHPNVDEASGSVCLDVINQTWSPMYDLVNIFSVFLPQLLLYPNPSDPLNGHAAALMFKEPDTYKARIREHVKKHASVDFKLQEDEEEVTSTHEQQKRFRTHCSLNSPRLD